MRKLTLNRLPLVEVTARFVSAAEIPTEPQFIVDLYDQLKGSYDTLVPLGSIEPAPGATPSIKFHTQGIIPGFALRAGDGVVLEIQTEMLSVRWRSTLGPDGLPNPRYVGFEERILPAMAQLVAACEELLGVGGVPVNIANMVYSNLIQGDDQGATLSRSYVSGFESSLFQDGRKLHQVLSLLQLANGTDLRYHLSGTGQDGEFSLQCSAGRRFEVTEARNAYDSLVVVHDALVEEFERLLTDEGKKAWQ